MLRGFEERKTVKGRWRAHKLSGCGYSEDGLKVIRLYNEVCASFYLVDDFSEALNEALELFTEDGLDEDDLEAFREMFEEAVALRNAGDPTYNTPRKRKLIRILWNNY